MSMMCKPPGERDGRWEMVGGKRRKDGENGESETKKGKRWGVRRGKGKVKWCLGCIFFWVLGLELLELFLFGGR